MLFVSQCRGGALREEGEREARPHRSMNVLYSDAIQDSMASIANILLKGVMHEDQWIAPTADYDTPCWHYRLTVRLQCHIWCNSLLEGVMGYSSDE